MKPHFTSITANISTGDSQTVISNGCLSQTWLLRSGSLQVHHSQNSDIFVSHADFTEGPNLFFTTCEAI